MIAIILFARKDQRYRMRVACAHLHPGERDRFEVASKDMIHQTVWSPVPDGSPDIPSSEWLTRRALWHLFEGGDHAWDRNLAVVDLGEV